MFLFLILLLVVLVFLVPKFKTIRCGNMVLITGGIKTGKTALSVHTACRIYRRNLFEWRIKCLFVKVLNKFTRKKRSFPEKPLLYSNVPLKMEYAPLTKGLILREERFAYKSVVYFCESSLICDSQYCKDELTNEQLLLFCKLFAHETHGGTLILDTQSISDNHYAVKRCLSSYFYIHHTVKLPFFLLMHIVELSSLEDTQTSLDGDIEKCMKWILVPKRVWKKYDCYAYSALTDDADINCSTVVPKSLKADNIVSLKTFKHLRGGKR